MQNSRTQPNPEHNIMTLTGKGQVTAAPDLAILRLGVQTTGENLTDIQSENARISQTVLQSLQQLGITDIKTYQYDFNSFYKSSFPYFIYVLLFLQFIFLYYTL